mmetsp:Transcript_11887/g.32965  ORF Transcript_11887/g.32965 Transcript_11887/m.32965 type:complete len:437 (-) Transcript_11887:170-1480(-)
MASPGESESIPEARQPTDQKSAEASLESGSDNGESDDSTLVSYPEDRSEWDSLSASSSQHALAAAFNHKWHEQEKEFQYRTKVLNRITSKLGNDPIYEHLWQRELQVRKLQRSLVLQTYVVQQQQQQKRSSVDYDKYDWDELPISVQESAKFLGWNETLWDEDKGPDNCKPWQRLSETQTKAASVLGYDQKKWDAEWIIDNDGLPEPEIHAITDVAIPSVAGSDALTLDDSSEEDEIFYDALLEHSHSKESITRDSSAMLSRISFDTRMMMDIFINLSLYVVAALCVDEILWTTKTAFLPRWCRKPEDGVHLTSPACFLCYCIQTCLGMLILRFSTRVLWFSSTVIYDCAKFDMHNGVRLGEGLPRIIMGIQKKTWSSWLVFIVGYNLVAECIAFFDELLVYMLFGYIESAHMTYLFDIAVIGICLTALNWRGYQM